MPTVKVCVKVGPEEVGIETRELPDPGPGQIFVRTEAATICGSDLHLVDRVAGIVPGTPQGHEAVGFVEAVGEGVQRIKVGDRVASSCFYGCGTCAICEAGDNNLCSTYFAPLNVLFGCQSEGYLVSSADENVAVIPKSSDARHVLLATDIAATGFAAVRRGELKEGQTVAIFAQGPVGLCATAAAKYNGAGRIFAVDSVPERRAMALQLGATDVLPPEGAAEAIKAATGGVGVDLAIEALGTQGTLSSCIQSIRMGGIVSSVGMYFGLNHVEIPTSGPFFQHKIVTSMCPAGHESVTNMLRIIESGQIDLLPLFTHSAALSDINQSYDQFRQRKDGVLKFVITP